MYVISHRSPTRHLQKTSPHGFTIVELLIVIVVIGILASITIVAYNGIQTRAENTKTITALKQFSNGISMHQITNGLYPISSWVCVGTSDGQCGKVSAGTTCFGLGSGTSRVAFDAAITASLGTVPQLSAQRMNCSGTSYAGALYNSDDGKAAGIYYLLRGNQPCASIGIFTNPNRTQQDDTTFCSASLPTLP